MSRVMSAPRMPQLVLDAQRQQPRVWWETPAKAAILILSAIADVSRGVELLRLPMSC